MAELASRERLQPALLDRLTDDHPDNRQPEPREARVINKNRFRQGVLRDIAWLLNSTRMASADELAGLGHVEASVVNFGLPALSGETASTVDVLDLEHRIRQALEFYEPRILASTLEVHALFSENEMHQHNVVSIEIRGSLWAHPIPLEMLLRTDLDLETGEVRIHDLDSSTSR
ncbi:MAG: type secretion system lysozyme [Betaproteobacteria bacterium]|nr:type secretion system lysozyme [Betaproteobacteria bacterium]